MTTRKVGSKEEGKVVVGSDEKREQKEEGEQRKDKKEGTASEEKREKAGRSYYRLHQPKGSDVWLSVGLGPPRSAHTADLLRCTRLRHL